MLYQIIKGEYLSPETIGIILNEVPPLINETDLHISQVKS